MRGLCPTWTPDSPSTRTVSKPLTAENRRSCQTMTGASLDEDGVRPKGNLREIRGLFFISSECGEEICNFLPVILGAITTLNLYPASRTQTQKLAYILSEIVVYVRRRLSRLRNLALYISSYTPIHNNLTNFLYKVLTKAKK